MMVKNSSVMMGWRGLGWGEGMMRRGLVDGVDREDCSWAIRVWPQRRVRVGC